MKILLVNDDGIHADGLLALYNEFSRIADVSVVAPATEKSAASGALTVYDILKVDTVQRNGVFFGYAVHGAPVDCTKLALHSLMDAKPDYVVSGINRGPNLSAHVTNSGTVAAASEAFFQGIPSVAVSLQLDDYSEGVPHDYSHAAAATRRWIEMMHSSQVPKEALYNINIPEHGIKGFKACSLSRQMINLGYERRESPRGRLYFWVSESFMPTKPEPDSDLAAIADGWIAVTPLLGLDRTDYAVMDKIKL
jgi:5'-nucleotidase